MKIVLALVILIGLALYFGLPVLDRSLTTREFDVHTAFGATDDRGIQMDVALTQGMVEREAPDGNTQYSATWQKWMDGHFELLDADGQGVAIEYHNDSKLISAKPGSPEVGFLRATLTPGDTYVLRYRPVRDEPLVGEGRVRAPDRPRSMFVLRLVEVK